MLNCLRVTDLAQVAGMNMSTKFIGIGELPQTYKWTKSLYEALNPNNFKIVGSFSEWNP